MSLCVILLVLNAFIPKGGGRVEEQEIKEPFDHLIIHSFFENVFIITRVRENK